MSLPSVSCPSSEINFQTRAFYCRKYRTRRDKEGEESTWTEETNLESTSCSGYKSAPFCDNYLHHQNHHMLFHLLCSFEVFPQKIVTSVGIYSLLSTFIISCVGVDSIFGAEIDNYLWGALQTNNHEQSKGK